MIGMSEMMATANASTRNRHFKPAGKRFHKIPYETHLADCLVSACLAKDFPMPLDFLPLTVPATAAYPLVKGTREQVEVHILEDEAASRAYIEQMWAEAMEIYRSRVKLAFSPTMQWYLKEHQRDGVPEDTKAGMIQAYLG